jgi:hypothetical protein
VETLRCLVSNIPQNLLSDIILDITQQHKHIEVVGRVTGTGDLPVLIQKESVDVLLIGMEKNMLPQVCNEVLEKVSNLLIVGLVDDGRSAAIYINNVGASEIAELISTLGMRPPL